MTANIWSGGGSGSSIISGGLASQRFSPVDGQTVFSISTFSYAPNTNSIWVYVNGNKQLNVTNYAESSSTSITLVTPVTAADIVEVIGFPIDTVKVVDNTIFHSFPFFTSGGIPNNIPLDSTGALPFYLTDLTPSNIPII